MTKPMEEYLVPILTLFSLFYCIVAFFLPENQILLWSTACLILFNFSLSVAYLLRQGTISLNVMYLNIVQLVLFGLLFILIHDVLGIENYDYYLEPRWYDWIILIATHILRAIDVVDCLSDYDVFYFQNINQISTFVGLLLVSMHIMVDFFILGAIIIFFHNRSTSNLGKWFTNIFEWLMRFRLAVLGGVIVSIVFVAINGDWAMADWFLWPLENILRTLDIGDAFEIFNWENNLHSVPVQNDDGTYKWGILGLAILFRLLVGAYVLGYANSLYLNLSKGRVMSVEDLEKICTSPDYSTTDKEIAITALLEHGNRVVPSFLNALAVEQSNSTRRSLIEALGEIGMPALPTVPLLVKALVDNNDGVRCAATIALNERIDPQWTQNESVSDVIPDIMKALSESDSQVRTAAAVTLGKIGASAIIAIPQLLTSLVDDKPTVRNISATALTKIDPEWWKLEAARSAIPTLTKAITNYTDVSRCAFAAVNLAKLEPQWLSSESARDAIHYLVKALAVTNTLDLGALINATLDQIDPEWAQSDAADRAIAYLVTAMVNDNESVCRLAKEALRKIDPTAEKAIPSLVKARTGKHLENRNEATEAFNVFEKIYPQWPQNQTALLSIPYLVTTLVNSDSEIRNGAHDILKKIDPFWTRRKISRRAIPYLLNALKKTESIPFAAQVLGELGKEATEAISSLVKVQENNEDEHIRHLIETALSQIDPGGHLRKTEAAN